MCLQIFFVHLFSRWSVWKLWNDNLSDNLHLTRRSTWYRAASHYLNIHVCHPEHNVGGKWLLCEQGLFSWVCKLLPDISCKGCAAKRRTHFLCACFFYIDTYRHIWNLRQYIVLCLDNDISLYCLALLWALVFFFFKQIHVSVIYVLLIEFELKLLKMHISDFMLLPVFLGKHLVLT